MSSIHESAYMQALGTSPMVDRIKQRIIDRGAGIHEALDYVAQLPKDDQVIIADWVIARVCVDAVMPSSVPAPPVEYFEMWNRNRPKRFRMRLPSAHFSGFTGYLVRLEIDVDLLRRMVRKALGNKSRKSSDGPLEVEVER